MVRHTEGNAINIRKPRPQEYEVLARIHAASFHTMHKGLVPEDYLASRPLERFIARWQNRLHSSSGDITYVAEAKHEIIGLITFADPFIAKQQGAYDLECHFLYVHPDYWRRGIGQALALFAAKEVQSAGFNQVYFWVLKNNSQSKSFYKKLGAESNGIESSLEGLEEESEIKQIRYTLELSKLIS